ncbi:AAA family ATPase [Nocardia sp. CDC159]|uniref:AAA family ATPase n=1 Tax=Nocardia pulmonis TaxID=2951408 RepID=A0A9X2IX20_9NOCA|nr:MULTISPECIES: ATP-binding protein [Nocardia]MCM6773380.1 AAA family ATPase [Nocardia pulmonis]MCM6786267.1 AAA family ATPase [Nocardia sp. CDC159]
MLIRFEVSNFRSILEPVELSMVAIDRDRDAAREASMLGESLLTVAGIYGPNASGKSNVLAALRWISDAVRSSVQFWSESIALDRFAFGDGPRRTSQFSVEMLIAGVRYEYVVELDSARIHYEGLFHYPEKKRRRLFEREGLHLVLQRGLGDLSGTRQLLTDQTLALSAARRFEEPVVSDFATALLDLRTRGVTRIFPGAKEPDWDTDSWFGRHVLQLERNSEGFAPTDSERAEFERTRNQALALLRLADLGIEDVEFVVDYSESPAGEILPRLVHRSSAEAAPLDFAAESAGTRNWYQLIGLLLGTCHSGSILLLDEIDASLHPTLSAQLLHLFHDPTTNPRGAQLIFTTHDTSLLNHLNRDEVWFTEKHDNGATRLGALAEFAGERVRKSQNLENAYLHGRFGALPDIDRAELLQALGFIA